MEEIRLSGSPAQLIAADDAEDDDESSPQVRFHEAANDGADDDGDDDDPEPEPEQLSPEEKDERS